MTNLFYKLSHGVIEPHLVLGLPPEGVRATLDGE